MHGITASKVFVFLAVAMKFYSEQKHSKNSFVNSIGGLGAFLNQTNAFSARCLPQFKMAPTDHENTVNLNS